MRAIKLLVCILMLLNCKLFAQTTTGGIYGSNFGEFTIGVDNGIISGNYLFLDNWDNEIKTYMSQNYFRFYGNIRPEKFKGSSFYNITIISDIDTAKTPGFIEISADGKKLTIVIKNMDAIDAAIDMSKYTDDNTFTLKTPLAIKQVAWVKSKQARLFNYEGGKFIAKKGYLVRGNDIALLSTIGTFSKILYKNPISGNSGEYYVQTSDLNLEIPKIDKNAYINNLIRLSN